MDKAGKTVDFLLTAKRDRAAAQRFLARAIEGNDLPQTVTIDQGGANTAGIESYNVEHGTVIAIQQGRLAACLLAILTLLPAVASAGPPFLTDDPEPVDYGHFETYVFSQWNSTSGSNSSVTGPAVEFNWGFLPELQFHVVGLFENGSIARMQHSHGYG